MIIMFTQLTYKAGCKMITYKITRLGQYLNAVAGRMFLFLSFLFVFSVVSADTVNINKADAAALQQNLNGVGEVKAQSIIDYRRKHGNFKNVSDLENVPGIGKEIINNNKRSLSTSRGLTRATEVKSNNTERKSERMKSSKKGKDEVDKKEKKSKKGKKQSKDDKKKMKADRKKSKNDRKKMKKEKRKEKKKAKKDKKKMKKENKKAKKDKKKKDKTSN